MRRIVHITTVHSVLDNRIFNKECVSLVARGFDVSLIACHDRSEVREGVKILPIPKPIDRLDRMTRVALAALWVAEGVDADIYHFHDPELLPVGAILSVSGRRVVYDVHEDNVASIMQKEYIPGAARSFLANACGIAERVLSSRMEVALAEKYYGRRFPLGTFVLNYPRASESASPAPLGAAERDGRLGGAPLLYTGNVTRDRGAEVHARIPSLVPDAVVHFVGRCESGLRDALVGAGGSAERLVFRTSPAPVPFDVIRDAYRERRWVAALALFPDTPHYREKELTKFFEYMQAGIPIICSNFPVWRDLVEGAGAGVCVDPDDDKAIGDAVRMLSSDRAVSEDMRKGGVRAASRYTWEAEAERLVGLYERMLSVENGDRSA